jgi:hypothetical protein
LFDPGQISLTPYRLAGSAVLLFPVSHPTTRTKTAEPHVAFLTISPVSDPSRALLPPPRCTGSDATQELTRGRRRAGCWRRVAGGHGGSGHRGEGGGRAGGREAAPDSGAPLVHCLHQIRLPRAAAGDAIHPEPRNFSRRGTANCREISTWWANEFVEPCLSFSIWLRVSSSRIFLCPTPALTRRFSCVCNSVPCS